MAKPTLNLDVYAEDGVDNDALPPALDENGVGGLSDDDFGALSFDNEEAERVSMEINPPPATWEKGERWEVTRTTNTEDSMPEDADKAGRTFIRAEGRVVAKAIEGQTYAPKLTITVSPDKRANRKDPSKQDMAYLHYVKVWELYVADNGQKPRNYAEFMAYLRDGNYFIRTFRGNNGPMVTELIGKADMKRRQR